MKLPIYQVDAFADRLFAGNPAAVVPLEEWLPDTLLQQIAMENNLAETAYFIRTTDGFHIRWFTPAVEVKLCGHATVASSHVIVHHLGWKEPLIRFASLSGELRVTHANGLFTLDFPSDHAPVATPPAGLMEGMGDEPLEIYQGKTDYLLIYRSEEDIRRLTPDFAALAKVDARGIIASAPGDSCDFVSRFFAPRVGINEDPVTGSAHTLLTPYWSKRLNKIRLQARQISPRGGDLMLEYQGERTQIAGRAVEYLKGEIEI